MLPAVVALLQLRLCRQQLQQELLPAVLHVLEENCTNGGSSTAAEATPATQQQLRATAATLSGGDGQQLADFWRTVALPWQFRGTAASDIYLAAVGVKLLLQQVRGSDMVQLGRNAEKVIQAMQQRQDAPAVALDQRLLESLHQLLGSGKLQAWVGAASSALPLRWCCNNPSCASLGTAGSGVRGIGLQRVEDEREAAAAEDRPQDAQAAAPVMPAIKDPGLKAVAEMAQQNIWTDSSQDGRHPPAYDVQKVAMWQEMDAIVQENPGLSDGVLAKRALTYVGAGVIIKSSADALSRADDDTDCMLDAGVYGRLWQSFDVDRFATGGSAQADLEQGGQLGVDGVTAHWGGQRNYASPPVKMVGQVEELVVEQQVLAVVIAAKWEAHGWWLLLVQGASMVVVLLPRLTAAKLPLSAKDLVDVLGVLSGTNSSSRSSSSSSRFVAVRDAAMFVVGWAGLLRSSEIVGLDWEDTAPGAGAWVFLGSGLEGSICPAVMLRALQQLAGGDAALGPVFTSFQTSRMLQRRRR
ncbi:hypothetical protein COO60DRAFT_1677572 [Scenedesmus sp. NREL 46B-D3]|nr:hypothetical protein COO60DRAFT_1677572 [Scenedesmus sp. NREL 46B-D3]